MARPIKSKLFLYLFLVLLLVIADLPLMLKPDANAHQSALVDLNKKYWVQWERFEQAKKNQNPSELEVEQKRLRVLSQKIHLLGGHIDEAPDACPWRGYFGLWRLLLTKMGFMGY